MVIARPVHHSSQPFVLGRSRHVVKSISLRWAGIDSPALLIKYKSSVQRLPATNSDVVAVFGAHGGEELAPESSPAPDGQLQSSQRDAVEFSVSTAADQGLPPLDHGAPPAVHNSSQPKKRAAAARRKSRRLAEQPSASNPGDALENGGNGSVDSLGDDTAGTMGQPAHAKHSTTASVQDFTALQNILNSEIRQAQDYRQLTYTIRNRHHEFNEQNALNALVRLLHLSASVPRAELQTNPSVRRLGHILQTSCHKLTCFQAAVCLRTLIELDYTPASIITELFHHILQFPISYYSGSSVALVFWSIGQLQSSQTIDASTRTSVQPLMIAFCNSFIAAYSDDKLMNALAAPDRVLVLWGLAKSNVCSHEFFQACCAGIDAAALRQLAADDIATLLWTCIKFNAKPPELLDDTIRECERRLHAQRQPLPAAAVLTAADASAGPSPAVTVQGHALTFSSATTVAWALAKLGQKQAVGLMTAIVARFGDDVLRGDVPVHFTARLLWSFAQLEYRPSNLLTEFAALLQNDDSLAGCRPEHLSMVVWSYCALDCYLPTRALDAIAACSMQQLPRFEAAHIATMVWAFAKMGQCNDELFNSLAACAQQRIDTFDAAQLADLLRAYAKFGLNPDSLFEVAASQVQAVLQGCNIVDLMRILSAYSMVGCSPTPMLEAVDVWARERLQSVAPQALAYLIWNYAKAGHASKTLLDAMADTVVQRCAALTPNQLARISWSFATLDYNNPGVLDDIAAAATSKLHAFQIKELATLLWSFAKLQHACDALLGSTAVVLDTRDYKPPPKCISQLLWSFAQFEYKLPGTVLESMAAHALAQLQFFEPQGLSMLMWSFAKLQHRPATALLSAVAKHTAAQLPSFAPQHMSNVLWSYATLNHDPGPKAVVAMVTAAELRIEEFSNQEMFNIAWALAKFHRARRKLPDTTLLLQRLASEAASRTFDFSPQELSNMLWVYATFRLSIRPLLSALAYECCQQLPAFSNRHIAIALWSYASLRSVDAQLPLPQQLLIDASQLLLARVDSMAALHASMVMKACAQLHWHAGDLTHAVQRVAATRLWDFQSHELSGLLWSYAVLDITPTTLLHAIVAQDIHCMNVAQRLVPQEVVHAAWSLTAMRAYDVPFLRNLRDRLAEVPGGFGFTQPQLVELQYTIALHALEHGSVLRVSGRLAQRASSAMRSHSKTLARHAMPVIDDMCSVLSSMDTAHRTMLSLDVGVMVHVHLRVGQQNLALQIVDEGDEIVGAVSALSGWATCHMRVLHGCGFTVHVVRMQHWLALEHTSAKVEYLSALLASASLFDDQ